MAKNSISLVISRRRQSDRFHRSVFDKKGERVETLSFSRDTPTIIDGADRLRAVADDIGGPLDIVNTTEKPPKIDLEMTMDVAADIAEQREAEKVVLKPWQVAALSRRATQLKAEQSEEQTPEGVED